MAARGNNRYPRILLSHGKTRRGRGYFDLADLIKMLICRNIYCRNERQASALLSFNKQIQQIMIRLSAKQPRALAKADQ